MRLTNLHASCAAGGCGVGYGLLAVLKKVAETRFGLSNLMIRGPLEGGCSGSPDSAIGTGPEVTTGQTPAESMGILRESMSC